jgi:hypothetical protein
VTTGKSTAAPIRDTGLDALEPLDLSYEQGAQIVIDSDLSGGPSSRRAWRASKPSAVSFLGMASVFDLDCSSAVLTMQRGTHST